MNYSEALSYIHSINWQWSKPGLSRTPELLKQLGNPEKSLNSAIAPVPMAKALPLLPYPNS